MTDEAAKLEKEGLVDCTIVADEVFALFCKATPMVLAQPIDESTNTALLRVTSNLIFADADSVLQPQNCLENCPPRFQNPAARSAGEYDFLEKETSYSASQIVDQKATEYALSVLLDNNKIVSRYLEYMKPFRVNKVELDLAAMPAGVKIHDFYYDQQLLVLSLQDPAQGDGK